MLMEQGHPIATVCWISVPNSLPYLYSSIILGLNSVTNVGVGFLMYLLVFFKRLNLSWAKHIIWLGP